MGAIHRNGQRNRYVAVVVFTSFLILFLKANFESHESWL